MLTNFIPGDAYVPFKDYEDYYIQYESYGGRDITFYNQTDSFNMSLNDVTDKTYGGVKVRFAYKDVIFFGWYFTFRHIEWEILGVAIFPHHLKTPDGKDMLKTEHIYDYYDNATDSSRIVVSCSHITLDITFTSADSGTSLFEAIENDGDITLSINYEIDFSKMGGNIWVVLANVLLFQTISTGQIYLDMILNALISIPLYTSIAYLIYKIVAGLLPFASGGGGA